MRKFWPVLFALLLCSCIGGGKKKEVIEEEKPAPPLCSAARVEITPDFFESPELIVGSGMSLELNALAYDASGNPVDVDLDWYFRGLPDYVDRSVIGQGHKLNGTGPMRSSMQAAGFTAETLKIAAEVPGCADEKGLPVRGTAKVVVAPKPDAPAVCGPASILYGRKEVSGETVIGFVPIRLKADVFGPAKIKKGLRVKFYLNGKHIKPDRKLIRDRNGAPRHGQEAAYWAYIPFWRPTGEYETYYELVEKGGEIVCASNTAYFTAR